MSLNCASAMQSTLGSKVGLMGFFRGCKTAITSHHPINLKMRRPPTMVLMNPEKTRSVAFLGFPLVHHVLGASDNSEVDHSVVRPNAIDVIDIAVRMDAMGVEPGKSVGRIRFIPNLDSRIPLPINRPGNISNLHRVNGPNLPAENSRVLVVVKFIFHALVRKPQVCGFNIKSQVRDSVIRRIAVNALNFMHFRKLTVDIEPRQVNRVVISSVDTDNSMPALVCRSSNLPDIFVVPTVDAPSKNSSIGVVVKKFAQTFCAKISLSHDVVPYKQLIGQKPGSVSALAGLCHFTAGAI